MPISVPATVSSTIFGWDASHYDGTLTKAILVKAAAEGIAFFTHKLGEAMGDVDPTAATALAAAHDAGIRVIGGYWFGHGVDDPATEARRCVAVADLYEPWWRTFDGWFWQADLESSPVGLPSPVWAKTFCDTLAADTGRTVIVYGSHGQYGDRLAGLGHLLWNANYPSRRQAGFRDLYPGDRFAGWTKYSGQVPTLCQYTSSATIAGLSTCDADAFRGTVDDLLTLIGADMALTDTDAGTLAAHKLSPSGESVGGAWQDAVTYSRGARDQSAANAAVLAGIVKTETAIQAVLAVLAKGGTSVDTAVLAAQIKTVGDAESAAVAALHTQLAGLQAKLAAAETAAATALAAK